MPIARPAAEIEPDSPTSSSSLILPGPRAPLARSMRMVSRATPLAYHRRRLSEEDVVIGWDEGVPKRGTDPRARPCQANRRTAERLPTIQPRKADRRWGYTPERARTRHPTGGSPHEARQRNDLDDGRTVLRERHHGAGPDDGTGAVD